MSKDNTDTGRAGEKAVEDLWRPRFKVISDCPGRRDFVVGEIITLDKDFSPQYKKYEIEDCQGVRTYITPFFEMFPLQFKRLEWWDDLKYSDLPKYVKWVNPADKSMQYFEVLHWGTRRVYTLNAILFIKDCLPATKAEYETFIKQAK